MTYLSFNKKKSFATLIGGIASIFMMVYLWLSWYHYLHAMFYREYDTIKSHAGEGDMMTVYNASEIDSVPIYGLNYKGDTLPRFSKTYCNEFDGDCLKLA